MSESFDIGVLINVMRKEHPNDDLYVEKSNGKRLTIKPEDEVFSTYSFLVIKKQSRDIAINPDHIISIINRGDL